LSGTFLSTWNETAQIQGSKRIIIFCINVFTIFFLLFQHLSLFPTITTASAEDLLSDALVSLDDNSNQSSEASGLLPYVSLFEGTSSSDLELNTEDERHVMPSDCYQDNNVPQESVEHSVTHFGTEWGGLSDQDDDIYDEVGSFGALEQCPSNKNDYTKGDSLDLAVNCFPEEPDGDWQFRDWSPDSLSHQEYDQDSCMLPEDDYRFLVIEYDSDIA
jgi:hypothetical protein